VTIALIAAALFASATLVSGTSAPLSAGHAATSSASSR
jgi:hypothetical protein